MAALTAGDWSPDEPRAAAELALYERALDRAARLLVDAGRLGLDERTFRLRAWIGEEIANLMTTVFENSLEQMGLDEGQWARAGRSFPPS